MRSRSRCPPADHPASFRHDIAADAGATLDTLRKHWPSIYRRVLFVDPLLFPDQPERNGRGRGKRRHLLRYLRLHMEELRPSRAPAPTRRPVERRMLPASLASELSQG